MKVNFETANKIWSAYFGNKQEATDAFGRKIIKNEHGTNSEFSWEVDHIWPLNSSADIKNGANVYKNVQPLSSKSNLEKGNNMQGSVNGVTFAIHKESTHEDSNIGRMSIKIKEQWYWAYDVPEYK